LTTDSGWKHTPSFQIFQATVRHPRTSLPPLEGGSKSLHAEPSVWKLGTTPKRWMGKLPSQLPAATSVSVGPTARTFFKCPLYEQIPCPFGLSTREHFPVDSLVVTGNGFLILPVYII